ncbi:MAG: AraC family transcriptional regulator [Bacteroidota bacterium]
MQTDDNTRLREGFSGQRLIVLPRTIISGFLNTDPITRHLYITDIGYYPKAKYHYAERPEGIDQHIIIYCTDGYGWLEIDGRPVTLSASQFIVIPAGTPHRYAANANKPWTIYWMHFRGDSADAMVAELLKNAEQSTGEVSFNETRVKVFENICANLEKGYSEDTLRYVNMIFPHFLSSLIYGEKSSTSITNDGNAINKAISFMQENVAGMLKLNEVARAVNLSPSHFSALFKTTTGHAPMEYFAQLKVQKACQYLTFTNMTVKQIAFTLGMADQYYFSRMFARLMAIPPTAYRKRHQNAG